MRLYLAFVALLALFVPTGSARAADAGVTAAVNPDAAGTPPAQPTRVLDLGTNVLTDEHLTTGPQGQLQLLLRDGSTVTMGPGADMTVDKFVYDPGANTAKLALTQTAGLIRIIGGRASKSDEGIVITTPTATVGIRGGIGRIEVNGQTGATNATLIYGKALTVNVDGHDAFGDAPRAHLVGDGQRSAARAADQGGDRAGDARQRAARGSAGSQRDRAARHRQRRADPQRQRGRSVGGIQFRHRAEQPGVRGLDEPPGRPGGHAVPGPERTQQRRRARQPAGL
ncbi:MAG: FecR domain-containing protein [Pseudomonadota bacterium]